MTELLSISNFLVEPENYEKPRSGNIAINPPKSNIYTPQAWSEIIRGKREWFYNFFGSRVEEKWRISQGENRRIFSEQEGETILSECAPGGDPIAKSRALNLPYHGYRHQDNNWYAQDVLAILWTSSKNLSRSDEGRTIWLGHGIGADLTGGGHQAQGVQIRFISDNL